MFAVNIAHYFEPKEGLVYISEKYEGSLWWVLVTFSANLWLSRCHNLEVGRFTQSTDGKGVDGDGCKSFKGWYFSLERFRTLQKFEFWGEEKYSQFFIFYFKKKEERKSFSKEIREFYLSPYSNYKLSVSEELKRRAYEISNNSECTFQKDLFLEINQYLLQQILSQPLSKCLLHVCSGSLYRL